MKSLNINMLTARLIVGAALLINSNIAGMNVKIAIWNDTKEDLKVTLKKKNFPRDKEVLSKVLIKAGKTLETTDTTKPCFTQIIGENMNKDEVVQWGSFGPWCKDLAFR